jgi:Fungal Zn(2)-Cys(6) binuclear cluster domain
VLVVGRWQIPFVVLVEMVSCAPVGTELGLRETLLPSSQLRSYSFVVCQVILLPFILELFFNGILTRRHRPCKTRKIKCDEEKPSCVNCRRQGEACDYSIRLNWDGRGKKKSEFGDGMITFGTSRPSSRDSTTTPATPNMVPDPARSYTSQPTIIKAEEYRPLPPDVAYSTGLQESSSQYDQPPQIGMRIGDYGRLPPDASYAGNLSESSLQYDQQPSMSIDPALMRPSLQSISMYEHQDFSSVYGRPDPQHAQSYERYRSLTPGTPSTPLSAQLPPLARLRQTQALEESLSPTDSGFGSPNTNNFSRSITLPNLDSPGLTPPFYGNVKDDSEVSAPEITANDRPLKRLRYHAGQDVSSSYDTRMPPPSVTSLTSYNVESQTSSLAMPVPASSVGTPLTPASSLSDDGYTKPYSAKTSPHGAQESPDLRRLSVSSLLSGPPGIPHYNDRNHAPRSNPEVQDWSVLYQDVYQETTTWGIDRGIKDLDIGKNDDMNAITGVSPIALRDHLELVLDDTGELMPVEFGFGMETNNTAFENGGYYDKPVAISIPKALEPLPAKLHENPMNLLVSNFHS